MANLNAVKAVVGIIGGCASAIVSCVQIAKSVKELKKKEVQQKPIETEATVVNENKETNED